MLECQLVCPCVGLVPAAVATGSIENNVFLQSSPIFGSYSLSTSHSTMSLSLGMGRGDTMSHLWLNAL